MRKTAVTAALLIPAGLLAGCFDAADEGLALDDEAALATAEQAVDAPRTPSSCAEFFRDEVEIAASAERVFDILADLPSYPEWNPWVVRAEGDLTPGGAVNVDVVLNGRVQKADHYVLTVEPYREICWRDAGWNSYLVYAQRCRTTEPLANGHVKLKNELFLDGPLAWLGKLTNGTALQSGIQAEDAAVKQRAEH